MTKSILHDIWRILATPQLFGLQGNVASLQSTLRNDQITALLQKKPNIPTQRSLELANAYVSLENIQDNPLPFVLLSYPEVENNISILWGFLNDKLQPDYDSTIAALQEAYAQSKSGAIHIHQLKTELAKLFGEKEFTSQLNQFFLSITERSAGQGTWVERATKSPRRATYLDVPEQVPELFNARADKSEDDIAFTKRVYGAGGLDLLRADHTGLAMSDLSTLDEPLHKELVKTQKRLRGLKVPQELPEDCPLPTRKERNKAVIEKINSGDLNPPTDYRAVHNLVTAAKRQKLEFDPSNINFNNIV